MPTTARSKTAALLAALQLFGATLGPAAQAQVNLPALGDAGTESLSIGDERRLGLAIMREARRDPDFLDDPVLLDYVQSLWQPLVVAAQKRGDLDEALARQLAFEIFLVRDRAVNAFAWPGGYVGIHLALVAITQNADQLASVLAHELTHVTQRHIARSIGQSQRSSLWSIAAILLGILAASRTGNADVANAAIMGGQGLAIQGQLNFSRDMEREADRIGYEILTNAGFAAAGMSQMFERLEGNAAVADSGAYPYLRTHPLTTDRISEARNRSLLLPAAPPKSTLMHALMQARSRVLMDSSATALARWAGGATSSRLVGDQLGAQYAGALAKLLQGDAAAAQEMAQAALARARDVAPDDAQALQALSFLVAETQTAKGQAREAVLTLGLLATQPIRTQAGAGSPAAILNFGPTRALMLARAQAALQWHAQLRRAGSSGGSAASSGTGPASAGSVNVSAAPAPAVAPADGPNAELRASTEALQTWLSEHPQDAGAWQMLAGTAQASGQRLRSMRAGAEARALLGDYNGAIDRLRAAQATSRTAAGQDFIEASVIDARLRQLIAERRQIALEARGGSGGPQHPTETDPSRQ